MRLHLSECESEICLEQILISEFEAQFKITNQSCVFAGLIMFYCKNNLKKSKKSLIHRLCQCINAVGKNNIFCTLGQNSDQEF